jgi:hypothetical protein
MNSFVRDPMREAADEASGFEGGHLHHNCKEGVVYHDGAPVGPDFRVCLLMETAMHGWLWFDDDKKLLKKDLKSFLTAKPNRGEWDGASKPNTSCLGVGQAGEGVVTYAGSSWAVHNAFMAQVFKTYNRVKGLGTVPVVSLGFKPGQKDEHGNFLPTFAICGWEPRSKYASILGPDPLVAIAPAAPSAAPQLQQDIIKPKMQTVTSGRQASAEAPPIVDDAPPIIDADDGYAGVDPGNVDFT